MDGRYWGLLGAAAGGRRQGILLIVAPQAGQEPAKSEPL